MFCICAFGAGKTCITKDKNDCVIGINDDLFDFIVMLILIIDIIFAESENSLSLFRNGIIFLIDDNRGGILFNKCLLCMMNIFSCSDKFGIIPYAIGCSLIINNIEAIGDKQKEMGIERCIGDANAQSLFYVTKEQIVGIILKVIMVVLNIFLVEYYECKQLRLRMQTEKNMNTIFNCMICIDCCDVFFFQNCFNL